MESTDIMRLAGYNCKVDTVISQETPINIQQINNPNYYRYQIRYEVNGLPMDKSPAILWRLDVTEYGESRRSAADARRDFETMPKIIH